MGIKIKQTGIKPKNLSKEIKRRGRAAAAEAGRAISEGLRQEVLARIPQGDRWLELYRRALTFLEDKQGTSWVVAGIAPTKLTYLPAETTQIAFSGTGPIADVMRPHIWTVDTLPAIAGGYRLSAVIRPASKSEMNSHREKLEKLLPEIRKKLKEAGATLENGFPHIKGRQVIDLRFLQLRLEHGLGGFPRVPHMKPAARAAKNKAHAWVSARKATIQKVLDGGGGTEAEVMDDNLKKLLENWRAKDFAR
jgi:hypothetical protein